MSIRSGWIVPGRRSSSNCPSTSDTADMPGQATLLALLLTPILIIVPRAVMRAYAERWRAKRGLPPLEFDYGFGGASRAFVVALVHAILAVAAAVIGDPTIALYGVAGAVIFGVWAMRDARRGRI
jgi:hypothetical protein